MKTKFILSPVFALSLLTGCSGEAPNPEQTNSASSDSPTNSEELEATVSEPAKTERAFSEETDGECYFFMTMRDVTLKDSPKPENFDNAKNYFEGRIVKQFNINFDNPDWASRIMHIQNDYMQKLSDKYGMANLLFEGEVHQPVCIMVAESDLGLPASEPAFP